MRQRTASRDAVKALFCTKSPDRYALHYGTMYRAHSTTGAAQVQVSMTGIVAFKSVAEVDVVAIIPMLSAISKLNRNKWLIWSAQFSSRLDPGRH